MSSLDEVVSNLLSYVNSSGGGESSSSGSSGSVSYDPNPRRTFRYENGKMVETTSEDSRKRDAVGNAGGIVGGSGSSGGNSERNDAVGKAGQAIAASDNKGRTAHSYLRDAAMGRQNAGEVTAENFDSKLQQALSQYNGYFDTFQRTFGERQDLTEYDRRRMQMAGFSTLNNGDFGNGLEDWKTYGEGQERQIKAQTAELRKFLDDNEDLLNADAASEIRSVLDQMDDYSGQLWRAAYNDEGLQARDAYKRTGIAYSAAEKAYQEAQAKLREAIANERSQNAMSNTPASKEATDAVEQAREEARAAEEALQKARAAYETAGGLGHSYSDTDRVASTVKGAVKDYGASLVGVGRVAAEFGAAKSPEAQQNALRQYSQDVDTAQRAYDAALQANGGDTSAEQVILAKRDLDTALSAFNAQTGRVTGEAEALQGFADKAQGTYDRLAGASAMDISRAKNGASDLTRFLVDAGVAGTQMLGDAAIGAATFGALSPKTMMAIRVFGKSAQEAKEGGGDIDQQILYGGGAALLEVATESMFDGLAGLYGAGDADEVVEKVIGRLAKNPAVRNAMRMGFGAAGEAAEEVVSGLVSPYLRTIYSGELSKDKAEDVLYDALVGGFLGLAGGGVGIANGQYAQANAQIDLNNAMNQAGVSTRSQAQNAMDVLSGRATPEQMAQRESAARATLAENMGGTDALSQYINNQRLGNYQNVQATPQETLARPTARPQAAPVEEAAPSDALRQYVAERTAPTQATPEASLAQETPTGEITQPAPQTDATAQAVELNSAPTPTAEPPAAETVTSSEAPATPEARRAEVQTRLDEINNLLETETDPNVIDELYAEGDALLKESQVLDNQIAARETQQSRIDNGEVSINYGTPENHIDNRTGDDMTSRKVKAFQFDHPELHGFFVDAAKALMEEVQSAEMQTRAEMYQKGSSVKRGPVRALMDNKLTKPRILQCLNDIIANNGQENYADAKRVEKVLSDMMSDGWTGMNRQFHEANADYIAAKEAIAGAVKADSWEKYYSDRAWMVDTGDATEAGLRSEWEAQQAAKSPADASRPAAPVTDTAQPAQMAGVPGGVPGGLAPWNTTTEAATNGMGNKRERNMTRNLAENENAEPDLRAYFQQNRNVYSQLTNNEVAAKAETIISKGFDAAREDIYKAIGNAQNGMKLAPEYAVAGYELANEMTRRGDINGATELCSSIAAELTYAGQLGQIGRLILNTPAARTRTVEKLTDKLNNAMTKSQRGKISKRNSNVTPTVATEAATAAKSEAVQMLSTALNSQGEAEAETATQWEPFDFPGEAAKQVADSIKAQIKNSLRPAKPKNAMDTFVNYVKKFAREKVGNLGQKSAPMTATQFLSEVVNNESLMREVYERAQAEFSNENASGYREFVADFVNTPMGLDSSDARNRIFTRAIAESAIASEENIARYVREQEALGVPRGEISSRIANDLIAKTGAAGAIADSIRNAAEGYVSQIIMGGELTSEEQVNRLVNNVMRTTGERFSALATQDGMTKEGLRDSIANDIATAYALSPESAERVADTVANEYDRLLGEAMQKELERRFKPKEKQSRQMKEFSQQLTEAINLGAFDSEYAQNAITKLFGAPGEITISPDLLQNYANAATDDAANEALEAIKDDIASQIPATFHDKFIALRYLNMLGNLKTQGRNIIGNTAMMIATDTKRTVQAVGELAATALSGGNYERNTSLFTNKEMRKQARDVFSRNVDDISGDAKYSDARRQVSRDIQDRVTVFGSGESSRWASDLLSRMRGREVDVKKNVLEDYRLLTNWAMEAGDEIFMRHTFTRAYAGWMKAHGVSDINNATQEQQNSAYEFAKKEAQEATFHDSNKFSDAVSNFGRGQKAGPLMRVISEGIMPFRKTPANVAVRAVEYSPVSAIKVLWDISGHMGNSLATDSEGNAKSTSDIINEASKSLTGSALFALGMALAAAGRARASGDDEDKDLNFFHKMQGASDYSVKIGDSYVSLSQFAPMSIPFFMGVKLNDLLENGMEDFSVDDIRDIFGVFSEPMLEMSMLSGVNDLFEDVANLSGDTGAIPGLVINSSLSYLSQGLTNSLLGQLEQAQEENRQTTYSDTKSEDATVFDKFVDGLQYKLGQYSAKTPGIDYHQEDYIDAWGRTQSNGGVLERYLNALLNPTYITGDRSTDVDAELERLHRDNLGVEGFPEVLPQKRGRSETIGVDITLTPDEYRRFSIESGQAKLGLVRDFMGSQQYQRMSDAERAKTIQDLYTFAEEQALQKVRSGYGIEKKSQWETEASLSNPAEYLAAKAVLRADEPDYSHMDDVFRNWGSYSSDTQDALKNLSGVNNMRFAFDELGMSTEEYNKVKSDVAKYEAEGLEGETKGAADAAVISKHYKGTDAEKLAALESQNLPDKQTGKRAAIVRRFEAAQERGVPFDTWAQIEGYVQDHAANPSSPTNKVLYAAASEYGYPAWYGKYIWRKDSSNEDYVTVWNDYFSQDYTPKEKADYGSYFETDSTPAPAQSAGGSTVGNLLSYLGLGQ